MNLLMNASGDCCNYLSFNCAVAAGSYHMVNTRRRKNNCRTGISPKHDSQKYLSSPSSTEGKSTLRGSIPKVLSKWKIPASLSTVFWTPDKHLNQSIRGANNLALLTETDTELILKLILQHWLSLVCFYLSLNPWQSCECKIVCKW